MAAVKGILGRKLGMTQVWDSDNRVIPVTVIQAGPCRVVQLKTPERDGYSAVQLAFGTAKEQRLSKPELGHLKKNGAPATKHLAELRVDDLSPYAVGQVIGADVFAAGERVDVTGISKGKGFTGVMQRHNFKGQGASHGNHKKHRSPGSIGACATPARVFKGMKMAGQHGSERVTTLNLEVVEGDAERGLLLVRGAVPGPNGAIVFVRNAVKGPTVAAPTLGGGGTRAGASESEPGASVSEAGVEHSAEVEESDSPPSGERPMETEVTSED
jgi:large subunit ribosomal protein L3